MCASSFFIAPKHGSVGANLKKNFFLKKKFWVGFLGKKKFCGRIFWEKNFGVAFFLGENFWVTFYGNKILGSHF